MGWRERMADLHTQKNMDSWEAIVDMTLSLNNAVHESGGVGFTMEHLKDMTLYEAMCILAPNRIRFAVKEKE